ncbi:hypothetical protein SpiGrapes_2264 [Sphaerochaeta pleomorpha str. Grapes]|uniref:Lcl C-terminal domain-containing protein n=1 Tax=Sphaerochaeta pleomorpha (strain ATCC BAA-1885 / DSM 22778 / Grapes) TaxID=158190 RepID=G8QSB0_SPHPG|nr:DUF1566 domain-containing protein [Sphaerochaeta pleomorpha]AEV30040.1 hypothetical protein SpiGrapes_2264 [Sphaerochaeta pleomorpha str. Grapes]
MIDSRTGKYSILLMVLVFLCSGVVFSQSAEYLVGQPGPSGGLVFYDKGEKTDGWRYLEVSPFSVQVMLPWGVVPLDTPTNSNIGSGKSNTEHIAAMQANSQEPPTAAGYCANLVFNGYSDWFLPSKEELQLLYLQYSTNQLGEFMALGYGYWTSTQYDQKKAWAQGFYAGVQGRIGKTELFLVRPIRSF